MERIVIFGGSFDPLHSAHKEIIEYLSGKFDKVILVPTTIRYYKAESQPMYSFSERCKKLKEDLDYLPNITISEIEESTPDNWRFIDTLKSIIKSDPNMSYYIAIGSDSFQNFKTWYAWEEIVKLAKLVVFNRPGYTDNFPTDIEYDFVPMNNPESSTRIRNLIRNNA